MMAPSHTSEIYRNIGGIQDLLERFGNKVVIISANELDYYNEEIQGLSTRQSDFVLEILRCYKSAAQFLKWQEDKITDKERIITTEEQGFNVALKALEDVIEVKEQEFNAVLEAKEEWFNIELEEKEEWFNIVLEGEERRFNLVLANMQSMITMLQNEVAKL
ncbi:hypothetical protein JOM56_005084 [Amanita muscaria]